MMMSTRDPKEAARDHADDTNLMYHGRKQTRALPLSEANSPNATRLMTSSRRNLSRSTREEPNTKPRSVNESCNERRRRRF